MFNGSLRIFAAALALWLCAGDHAQAKPITLAYNTNSLNVMLPILVAQELGFFTAEGFEVTPVYVRSGPTVMAAMVSGASDYSIVGSTTVVQAIAKGVPGRGDRQLCPPCQLDADGRPRRDHPQRDQGTGRRRDFGGRHDRIFNGGSSGAPWSQTRSRLSDSLCGQQPGAGVGVGDEDYPSRGVFAGRAGGA